MFNSVLLIEDNLGDARLVSDHLSGRFGPHGAMLQAPTLAAGLDVLRREPVDLVLLDLGLPDSHGLQGYFAVHRQAPDTPVLILTGEDDDEQAAEALRVGAEEYLPKQQANSVTLVRAMRHAIERSKQRQGMRESESRMRALVDAAGEGVLQLDSQGRVLYLNAWASQMLGLPADGTGSTPGNRPVAFLDLVRPADHSAAQTLLGTPMGRRSSCELGLLRPDGARCWVVAAAGSYLLHDDATPETVLILTDITLRKLDEDSVRQVKYELECRAVRRSAMLESATAELHTIHGALAHDLRDPLHGIIGMTRLMRTDEPNSLPAKAHSRLDSLEQSALDMDELLSGLMSMTGLNPQVPLRDELDLSAMAQAIAMRLSDATPQRAVRWVIAPGLQAWGDLALVTTVLENLLDNAWKHSSKASPAVIEFGQEDAPARGVATYFVRDNGLGFEPGGASLLFEPFQRRLSSRARAGNGLGLGTVKRIVALHGGEVWAECQPGVATTFRFTLERSPQGRQLC